MSPNVTWRNSASCHIAHLCVSYDSRSKCHCLHKLCWLFGLWRIVSSVRYEINFYVNYMYVGLQMFNIGLVLIETLQDRLWKLHGLVGRNWLCFLWSRNCNTWAMPWFRRLVAYLSLRKPGCYLTSVRVRVVVGKVAVRQVCLCILRFRPVSNIPLLGSQEGLSFIEFHGRHDKCASSA